nr:LytTR family DNA-binding domain-containing protein [Marinicella sp. NBU2979]
MLLPSDNQADGFKVKPANLVCLKTSDNYLEVYYLNDQAELQNRMIRSSMKKMEQNLNTEMFYRPHQSYLVNLSYIQGLKKVQNNHFLEMAYLDFDVAISRKNVKHIKAQVVN